jgi:hypothetical protein
MKRGALFSKCLVIASLALCVCAVSAEAAGLSVRLVEAHNDSAAVAGGLRDVSGTLRKNLPYTGFDLLSSRSLPLPANGSASLSHGFSVQCTGPQSGLKAVIKRNGKQMLSTTLNLRSNTPVILGGFTSSRGRILVLLVAR